MSTSTSWRIQGGLARPLWTPTGSSVITTAGVPACSPVGSTPIGRGVRGRANPFDEFQYKRPHGQQHPGRRRPGRRGRSGATPAGHYTIGERDRDPVHRQRCATRHRLHRIQPMRSGNSGDPRQGLSWRCCTLQRSCHLTITSTVSTRHHHHSLAHPTSGARTDHRNNPERLPEQPRRTTSNRCVPSIGAHDMCGSRISYVTTDRQLWRVSQRLSGARCRIGLASSATSATLRRSMFVEQRQRRFFRRSATERSPRTSQKVW